MASSSRKTSRRNSRQSNRSSLRSRALPKPLLPVDARNDVDWMVMPGHLLSAVVQGLARPAQCSQVTCRFAEEWPEKRMLLTRLGIDLSNATSLLWNVL